MGKAEQGEGPVNDLSGERADHGRSALDFRVEQESGTKEGKQWTFERNRKVKQERTTRIYFAQVKLRNSWMDFQFLQLRLIYYRYAGISAGR